MLFLAWDFGSSRSREFLIKKKEFECWEEDFCPGKPILPVGGFAYKKVSLLIHVWGSSIKPRGGVRAIPTFNAAERDNLHIIDFSRQFAHSSAGCRCSNYTSRNNHPISTFDVGWQPEKMSLIARLPAGLYYSILFSQNMRAFGRLVQGYYGPKNHQSKLNLLKFLLQYI